MPARYTVQVRIRGGRVVCAIWCFILEATLGVFCFAERSCVASCVPRWRAPILTEAINALLLAQLKSRLLFSHVIHK